MKHFITTGDFTSRDIDLIFGPLDGFEEVVHLEAQDMETLAVEAGVFPSKGQARKNGFKGSVPWGLNLFGTKKRAFWVWSPEHPDTEPTINPSFDRSARWFSQE